MTFDSVEHGVEAVGSGGREVVGETDFSDEVGFGVDDLPCAAAGIDLRQQGDQARNNGGIPVGEYGHRIGVALHV